MVLRTRRTWVGTLTGLLLLVGAAGCGGESTGGRETLAVPASPAPADVEVPAEADEKAIARLHARTLAEALGLDAGTEDRVRDAIERRWAQVQTDVAARRAALLPTDEEQVTDLIAAHQRALDVEIAAILGPARRAALTEHGGRLDADAAPTTAPATTAPATSAEEAR